MSGKVTNVGRRHFLNTGVLSGSLLFLTPWGTKAAPSQNEIGFDDLESAFLVESGLFGKDDLVAVGFLSIGAKQEKHELALQELKAKFDYRNILSYQSNDRFKTPVAKAFIDYFLQAKDLELVVKVNRASPTSKSQLAGTKFRDKKIALYQQSLALTDSSKSTSKKVWVKCQNAFGPSEDFKNQFFEKTSSLYDIIDSRNSNLIQLADLLTGIVRADFQGTLRNKVKLGVSQYFKDRLEKSTLSIDINLPGKLIIHSE